MYFNATTILNYYSMPLFYAILSYIGAICFLIHIGICNLFMNIPLKTIFKPMIYITCLSLLFTLIAGPLGMILSGYLAQCFYGPLTIKYFQTIFFLICTLTTIALIQEQLRKKFVQLSNSKNQKFFVLASGLCALLITHSLQIIGLI